MHKNCSFCEIVKGNQPADKVLETDLFHAFLDADPITTGHILVVPVRHIKELLELKDDEWCALKPVIDRLTAALLSSLSAEGVSIMQNGGGFDSIGHVHWHLIPRTAGDGFGWFPGRADASAPARCEVAVQIKATLAQGERE